MELSSLLQQKLQELPKDPGVYFMKDAKGQIIYVGKAKILKNRVSSYFQKADHSHKTRSLVAEIVDFDIMLCNSEKEALLLERTLIRHHAPRFNILLRDDKEYPYVRIDYHVPWPRIERVRRRRDDNAEYIGPFASSGALNFLIRTIYRTFPLIRCSPHQFKTAHRPCNYYHIKLCLGPCTLPVSRDHYVSMVHHAADMLRGNTSGIIEKLQQEMQEAASAEHYERAATLRDQITNLKNLHASQAAIVHDYQDADVVAIVEKEDHRCCHVVIVRRGAIIGGENYYLGKPAEPLEDSLVSFLLQRYDGHDLPKDLILPMPLESIDAVQQLIQEQRHAIDRGITTLRVAKDGEALDLVKIAQRNAEHHLEHTVGQKNKRKVELEELQEMLAMDFAPSRIECIDISNTQGTAIVASNVCFVDGKPAKEFYRKYNVKTVTDNPDDFASMQEIVTRRIERGLRDDDMPDLLVVDGGRGQLNAALAAREQFPGCALPIVGLAKSRLDTATSYRDAHMSYSEERLFLPNDEQPHPLPVGTPVYRLLTSLRDEAHRFAITFHRKKRQQHSQKSQLDDIPGLGPVLKKRLLQHFGSVAKIKQASLDELMTIKGLKEATALALHSTLQSGGSDHET